jgi:hypothetical protein
VMRMDFMAGSSKARASQSHVLRLGGRIHNRPARRW